MTRINQVLALTFGMLVFYYYIPQDTLSWTKSFTGYVREIEFTGAGNLMAVGINYVSKSKSGYSSDEIFVIETTSGKLKWQYKFEGFIWSVRFLPGDEYLMVSVGIGHDDAGDDIRYFFNSNGELLWKMVNPFKMIFSTKGSYVAEFATASDEPIGGDEERLRNAMKRIVIRKTENGEIIDTVFINGFIRGSKFISDSTLAVGIGSNVLEIKTVKNQTLISTVLDKYCVTAIRYLTTIEVRDSTRFLIACGDYIYFFDEDFRLIKKLNDDSLIVLKEKPDNGIGVFLGPPSHQYYYFSKSGEILGKLKFKLETLEDVDLKMFKGAFSKYVKYWKEIYYSGNRKHVVAVLQDGNTIQYLPYEPD